MKAKSLLSSAMLATGLFSSFIHANDLAFIEAFTWNNENVITQNIKLDNSGNIYLSGEFQGSVDLDPTAGVDIHTASGLAGVDLFITKINADGSYGWSGTIDDVFLGNATLKMAVNSNGDVYLAGNFWKAVDLDPTIGIDIHTTLCGTSGFCESSNSRDVFLTKLNTSGGYEWSRTIKGTDFEAVSDLRLDGNGDVRIFGGWRGTVDFDPTTGVDSRAGSTFYFDQYITKIHADGTYGGTRSYGGSLHEAASAMAIDASDSVITMGGFQGSVDFAPAGGDVRTADSDYDTYLTKTNANGSYAWTRTLDPFISQLATMEIDGAGNIYIFGSYLNSVDFDPAGGDLRTSNGNSDLFVSKYNADGSYAWTQTFGTPSIDSASAITVTGDGHVYASGYISKITNVSPGTIFIASIEPDGTLAGLHETQGNSLGNGLGIAINTAGTIYVAGVFQGSGTILDLDPSGCEANFSTATFTSSFVAQYGAATVQPLVANAGPDQTVNEMSLVTLDGAGSSEPNCNPLIYQWSQIGGTPVFLDETDPVHPVFSAPSVPAGGETLTFQLIVDNGMLSSDQDTVNITVKNVNHPPVADAGEDQTVQEGSIVDLNGSFSYDNDGETLTYDWAQLLGTTVALSDPAVAEPSFTAPLVGVAGETLSFELSVSDGIETATDAVDVFVENVNHAPTADAGPDQTVAEGSAVSLTGVDSNDPDGDSLNYTWNQDSGTLVTLLNNNTVTPNFTAPYVGPGGETLVFSLVVNDGELSSTNLASVNINILNANDPPACGLAQANPGKLWPPNHKLVPVEIINVTDPDNDNVILTVTSVMQDEPVNGLGDGDTSPDAVIHEETLLVRAERSGMGNGRVYQINFEANDGQGGVCNGTVIVTVPHNKNNTAVDDGQAYNATQP